MISPSSTSLAEYANFGIGAFRSILTSASVSSLITGVFPGDITTFSVIVCDSWFPEVSVNVYLV